jgi:tRNA (guanosine-2'-O-)-methyltransferase
MSPERYKRIRHMLAQRQTDLTVCLENVHKPHNVSAVIRTCDAVGIHRVHTVNDDENAFTGDTAMGSQHWVKVSTHDDIAGALGELKAQGMQVLVTHVSDTAVDFRQLDYTRPTAVLFGQEKFGATEEALALADQDIVIPMVGMVQSLNVSVAAALVLYEAQRQRQQAGLYDVQHLSEDECQQMLFAGSYPRLYELCQRKGLPNPPIDETGEIVAEASWWQQLQLSPSLVSSLHTNT